MCIITQKLLNSLSFTYISNALKLFPLVALGMIRLKILIIPGGYRADTSLMLIHIFY